MTGVLLLNLQGNVTLVLTASKAATMKGQLEVVFREDEDVCLRSDPEKLSILFVILSSMTSLTTFSLLDRVSKISPLPFSP